ARARPLVIRPVGLHSKEKTCLREGPLPLERVPRSGGGGGPLRWINPHPAPRAPLFPGGKDSSADLAPPFGPVCLVITSHPPLGPCNADLENLRTEFNEPPARPSRTQVLGQAQHADSVNLRPHQTGEQN